ncbi:hypothetical protein [Flavobacterium sp.]|uniref:hypothetical protein n=1 Tax=Flavobacterium sp. TaxID=239 RepID=UPI0012057DC8|nr:hypothetical protein [Flavobacterium sp.]RZJ72506.1 MAG: hypothetical protein EOO49_06220 [Flavobacterium sp.]
MKIVFFLLCVSSVWAQRFDLLSGNFESIKDIPEFNIVFDYDGMQVHDYESEEAYLKIKFEQQKEKPEKAKAFVDNWYADRTNKYEPRFIDYFNERFEKGEVKIVRNGAAKYTIKVKTVWLYPGYGMGPSGQPSKITAIISVFETENPTNVLVSVKFDKTIGMENRDPNKFGERISGAYEKLAKNFVMQLKRVR